MRQKFKDDSVHENTYPVEPEVDTSWDISTKIHPSFDLILLYYNNYYIKEISVVFIC